MTQLSREKIKKMKAATRGGSGGGGSTSLAGYASQAWVDENYVAIDWFEQIFQVFDNTTKLDANGEIPADTSHLNIKAMFGFWTEQYISALGFGASGSSGGATALTDLVDVAISGTPTDGQALIYNATQGKWVAGTPTTGTVTRVAMSVPTGFNVTGSPITESGTLALSFDSGYSLPTTAKQSNWDTAYDYAHSHSNKSVLDGITSTKVSHWNTAYDYAHSHSNKSVLDGITSTKVSHWDTAYGWGDHANAGYLTSETDPTVPAWAKESTKPSYAFSEITGKVTFAQMPDMYWANVAVSGTSNSNTSPQFGSVRIKPDTALYGGYLYFGDGSNAYIAEVSDNKLTYYASTHIFNNGNVGIGISNPINNLDVNGTTFIRDALTVKGSIWRTPSIHLNSVGDLSGYGGHLDFHYNGSSNYTSRIIEDTSGMLYIDNTKGLRIGNAVLSWDSTNNALKIQKSDGTSCNLYATGGVSALGMSSGSSYIDTMTFGNVTVNENIYAGQKIYIGGSSAYIYLDGTTLKFYNGSATKTVNTY